MCYSRKWFSLLLMSICSQSPRSFLLKKIPYLTAHVLPWFHFKIWFGAWRGGLTVKCVCLSQRAGVHFPEPTTGRSQPSIPLLQKILHVVYTHTSRYTHIVMQLKLISNPNLILVYNTDDKYQHGWKQDGRYGHLFYFQWQRDLKDFVSKLFQMKALAHKNGPEFRVKSILATAHLHSTDLNCAKPWRSTICNWFQCISAIIFSSD